MSTFKIGQRVRVARNVGRRHASLDAIVGAEGTVSGFVDDEGDGHTILLAQYGRKVFFHPADLEPIVPPHEASEYTFRELMDRLKAGEVECV